MSNHKVGVIGFRWGFRELMIIRRNPHEVGFVGLSWGFRELVWNRLAPHPRHYRRKSSHAWGIREIPQGSKYLIIIYSPES